MPRPGQHKTGTRQSQEHSGLAQDCSRQAQDWLKTAQDTPKIGPRLSKSLQHSPRLLKTRARQAQDRPRKPWALPKTTQDELKTRPRRAQARAKSFLGCLASGSSRVALERRALKKGVCWRALQEALKLPSFHGLEKLPKNRPWNPPISDILCQQFDLRFRTYMRPCAGYSCCTHLACFLLGLKDFGKVLKRHLNGILKGALQRLCPKKASLKGLVKRALKRGS